jgi:pyruvate kinase
MIKRMFVMMAKASAPASRPEPFPNSDPPVSIATAAEVAQAVLEAVVRVRESVQCESERILPGWNSVIALADFHPSAENLARYLALRTHDLSQLQPRLSALGLSSLGRCEGHVMANLDAVIAALSHICGASAAAFPADYLWAEGERRLDEQRRALFGRNKETTAVMVTLPSEAATDAGLVENLVAAGADCARINCAHDDAKAWAAMAAHVRSAAVKLGRDCRILMDLPGPKCRVETLSPAKPKRVREGDRFCLAVTPREAIPGGLAVLTVSFPDVVARLPVDSRVWIDDGKIRCRVVAVEGNDRILEVVGARPKGEKLRLEKGVNFPGLPLGLPALSADDLAALPTIAMHADIVGFSFVQRPQDILDLDRAIEAVRPGVPPMPLVLKIETIDSVRNLPQLIIQAAGTRPTAVMIARGDLAVELGHLRLAEIRKKSFGCARPPEFR